MTGTVYVLAVIGAITILNFALAMVMIVDAVWADRRRARRRAARIDAELARVLERAQ